MTILKYFIATFKSQNKGSLKLFSTLIAKIYLSLFFKYVQIIFII